MNLASLLSSLNKIGLVAFLITLGFLIYEIVQLRKTSKAQARPKVPQFQEGKEFVPSSQQIVEKQTPKMVEKNKLILVILIVLLIFFGAITLFGYVNLKLSEEKSKQPTVTSPTSKVISKNIKAAAPEMTPTEIPTPTLTSTPTPSELPLTTYDSSNVVETPIETPVETTESSSSPTVIEQLPQTGYVNNLLILFSLAGLVLFFSFLF